MARENYTAESKVLIQRYELSEHREVARGIWLPIRLRNIQFDYNAATEAGRRRRVIDTFFTVEEVEVNSVPDQLFDFTPSPGSLLLHDDFRPESEYPVQVERGGLELVDRIVEWIHAHTQPTTRGKSYGWLVGFLAIPVIACLEIGKRCFRHGR